MTDIITKTAPITGEVLPPKSEFDSDGFAKGGRPTCPFCHAPWTAANIQLYDLDASDHCASGRFYAECCTVSISCHACEREMYRKEGAEFGYCT